MSLKQSAINILQENNYPEFVLKKKEENKQTERGIREIREITSKRTALREVR
jgi:hypothetical protein